MLRHAGKVDGPGGLLCQLQAVCDGESGRNSEVKDACLMCLNIVTLICKHFFFNVKCVVNLLSNQLTGYIHVYEGSFRYS